MHKTSRHNPSVAAFSRNIPRIPASSQACVSFPLIDEITAIPQKQCSLMVKNQSLAWLPAFESLLHNGIVRPFRQLMRF